MRLASLREARRRMAIPAERLRHYAASFRPAALPCRGQPRAVAGSGPPRLPSRSCGQSSGRSLRPYASSSHGVAPARWITLRNSPARWGRRKRAPTRTLGPALVPARLRRSKPPPTAIPTAAQGRASRHRFVPLLRPESQSLFTWCRPRVAAPVGTPATSFSSPPRHHPPPQRSAPRSRDLRQFRFREVAAIARLERESGGLSRGSPWGVYQMQEQQEAPGSAERATPVSTRIRLTWILLAGSFAPVLVAKYLIPSLMVPMLVLSGVMIVGGVLLILTHSPTDQ